MRRLKQVLAISVASLIGIMPAHADEWRPTQPVRMVVAFAAGGPVDLVAREFAPRLEQYLGQPVIIENMGGAGGLIGAQAVAQAPANGETIFFAAAGNVVIRPLVARNTDIIEQLRSVGLVTESPHALVVHAGLPIENVAELIEYAKARPGELNFGSAGTGAAAHLGFEMFKLDTGVDIEHIPYSGVGPSLIDLASGAIDLTLSSLPSLAPLLDAGQARVIGLSGNAPDNQGYPLVSETVPGYGYSTWYGVMVPTATDDAIVQVLNDAFAFAAQDEALQARLEGQGIRLNHSTPAEMEAFFQEELVRWGEVIEAANVTIE